MHMTTDPLNQAIRQVLDAHAANAGQLALDMRDALGTSTLRHLFGPSRAHVAIITEMAASLSAFETSRGPEPWDNHPTLPMDWRLTCKTFADAVAAYLMEHGEQPNFDALLKQTIANA
jgi:hypothetical protein